MRILLVVPLVLALILPAAAEAITVDVRIEGANRTVFEGPVDSGVRQVKASSDAGGPRTCDGTNNGANSTAGPTATSVAVDALALQGQDFDGRWYPGFQDYLISRFGPESSRSWGVYRNDQSSSVGGCQLPASTGDRILWAAGTSGGSTALLQIGVSGSNPYTVAATTPTGASVAGATVYDADASGNLASTGVSTDANGRASVALGAGYHRLKVGRSGYVRSARAVVCAEPCGGLPPDVAVRAIPPVAQAGVQVSRARQLDSGYRRGLIRLDWRLLRPGVGIRSWRISSDDLSTRARLYRVRARGSGATTASLRLPRGRTYALKFDWTDGLLRSGRADFGRVIVPIDERSKSVHRAGRWSAAKASTAWAGTLLRGRAGARLRVKLARGKPTLLLSGGHGRAVLRVTAGRTTRIVRVAKAKTGAHQFVNAFRRKGSGTVSVRVLRGTIYLDGVAASP